MLDALRSERVSFLARRYCLGQTSHHCHAAPRTAVPRPYHHGNGFLSVQFPGSAARLLDATRAHWGIENSLHWVPDVAFREDDQRFRTDNGPQNAAILRHVALNMLKQETTAQGGVQTKRLRAGWDDAYLLKVLGVSVSSLPSSV